MAGVVEATVDIRGNLERLFGSYARLGNSTSDGTTISLDQVQLWFQHATVVGETLTTADAAEAFDKFKLPNITFTNFLSLVDDIIATKNLNGDDIRRRLTEVRPDEADSTTPARDADAPAAPVAERTDELNATADVTAAPVEVTAPPTADVVPTPVSNKGKKSKSRDALSRPAAEEGVPAVPVENVAAAPATDGADATAPPVGIVSPSPVENVVDRPVENVADRPGENAEVRPEDDVTLASVALLTAPPTTDAVPTPVSNEAADGTLAEAAAALAGDVPVIPTTGKKSNTDAKEKKSKKDK